MKSMLSRMNPLVFVVGCAFTLCLQAVYAEIPNSGPEAYLEKDFRRDFLAYNQRTLNGAYQQVGSHNPQWDALVTEYLDGQAVRFANHYAKEMNVLPQTTSDERMSELARQLESLLCDDPLVAYISLIYIKTADDQDLERAREAYRGLLASEYPINRKLHAAWRLMTMLQKRDQKQELEQIEQVWVDLMCQAVEDPQRSLTDQYFLFWAHRDALWDETYVKRWDMVVRRIDVPAPTNPWLVGVICGFYHKQMAWEARGSGWARTVTEEGWRGFRNHLNLAYTYLDRAWEFSPRFPEVASEMISVCMGMQNNQERVWFNRSVEAQFDHNQAYKAYLWAIRPRWGGSYEQMYAFGVECLETGRFDTFVPAWYYQTMLDIADDDDGYNYWKRPGAYEHFMTYFDAQKNNPDSPTSPQWWDSMKAVTAWRIDRYKDAVDHMQALGDELSTRAFSRLGGDPVLAPSECYAKVNIPEEVFDQARAFWLDNKYRSASEVFDAAIVPLQADDPARPYLRHLSVWAKRLHQQQQGTWIDLLGEPDVIGWIVRRGEWAADELGRLTGTSDEDGLMLECRLGLGYRLEIEGSLTYLDDPTPKGSKAGVLLAFRKSDGKYYHRSIVFDPNTGEAEAAQNFGWRQPYPANIGKSVKFHIQMWDETVRLSVDDVLIYEGLRMRQDLPDATYPFALGGWFEKPGVKVRYDTLRARPLKLRPPWVFDPQESGGLSSGSGQTQPPPDRVAI